MLLFHRKICSQFVSPGDPRPFRIGTTTPYISLTSTTITIILANSQLLAASTLLPFMNSSSSFLIRCLLQCHRFVSNYASWAVDHRLVTTGGSSASSCLCTAGQPFPQNLLLVVWILNSRSKLTPQTSLMADLTSPTISSVISMRTGATHKFGSSTSSTQRRYMYYLPSAWLM